MFYKRKFYRRKTIYLFFCTFLFLSISFFFPKYRPLYSQNSPINGLQPLSPEQENILRLKRQEENEFWKRLREKSEKLNKQNQSLNNIQNLQKKNQEASLTPPHTTKPQNKKNCIAIKKIYILNDKKINPKENQAKELLQKWLGNCLNATNINHILRAVNNFYSDKGYITTRAYIAPQKIKNGTLKIHIIIGRVEVIRFAQKKGYRSELFTAFPFITGSRLNLRSIEQGLEQINRLRSNTAKVSFFPGKKAGNSRIIITNSSQKLWNITANINNENSSDPEKFRSSLALELDSPLFLNDYWKIHAEQNIKEEFPDDFSNAHSYYFHLPLGYWSASFLLSEFSYKKTIQTNPTKNSAGNPTGNSTENFQMFKNSGDSYTHKITIDHVLYRDTKSKLLILYEKQKKDSHNFIDNTQLLISSRKLEKDTFQIRYNHRHSYRFGEGNGNVSINLQKGKLSPIPDLDQHSSFSPHLNFQKESINAAYSLGIFSKWLWQISFQGQHSDDILFSSEQFAIGGLYSVRGFRKQSLQGDVGFYVRNEIHYSPWAGQKKKLSWFNHFWKQSSFFIAYDRGGVFSNLPEEKPTLTPLSGMALGLINQGIKHRFQLTLSQSLHWPSDLKRENAIWTSFAISF